MNISEKERTWYGSRVSVILHVPHDTLQWWDASKNTLHLYGDSWARHGHTLTLGTFDSVEEALKQFPTAKHDSRIYTE